MFGGGGGGGALCTGSANQGLIRQLSVEFQIGGTGLGVHLHPSLWAVWPFWGWPGILELLPWFSSQIFHCKCFVFSSTLVTRIVNHDC